MGMELLDRGALFVKGLQLVADTGFAGRHLSGSLPGA
jgi:hypothetical protein